MESSSYGGAGRAEDVVRGSPAPFDGFLAVRGLTAVFLTTCTHINGSSNLHFSIVRPGSLRGTTTPRNPLSSNEATRLLLDSNVNLYAPFLQGLFFISCLFVALALGIRAHARLGTNWS